MHEMLIQYPTWKLWYTISSLETMVYNIQLWYLIQNQSEQCETSIVVSTFCKEPNNQANIYIYFFCKSNVNYWIFMQKKSSNQIFLKGTNHVTVRKFYKETCQLTHWKYTTWIQIDFRSNTMLAFTVYCNILILCESRLACWYL